MTSPGQELRKEREARGISLKAIADATRIAQRYLEAVESDRLDLLPGGFFNRGILRAYAGAIGLDEETVLESFRRAGALTGAGPAPSRKPAAEGGRSKTKTRSLAGAVAALIVVISFAAYFMIRPGRTTAPPPAPQPSTGAQERPEAALPDATLAAAALAPRPEKGLRFEISFIQETWIQVYADSQLVLDGIREAGNTAEVRAENELLIHLGNAGGLAYTLNGRPGKPFGTPGAVVKNIRITEANLASFILEDGTGEP